MIKTFNIVMVVLTLMGLAGVYVLKYQTETLADEKYALKAEIARAQNDLSVLRADWAYLSQPSNVEPLIARHQEALGLEIISSSQFGSIAEIPMRPSAPDAQGLDDLFRLLDAGIDPIGDKLSELLVN